MSTAQSTSVWRLGSIGNLEAPRTVLEIDGELFELDPLLASSSAELDDSEATTVRAILEAWDEWAPRLDALARDEHGEPSLSAAEVHWLPPVVFPRKVIICGANYRPHVIEMGGDPDAFEHPYTSMKPPTTTLVGHNEPIVIPKWIKYVDWEGELGVVISRRTKYAKASDALASVAGYCPVNDVSARDWAEKPVPGVGPDWMVQKGFDSFTPAGPLITPAQYVPDPQRLQLELTVNGAVKQSTSTSDMIFGVAQLIEYLSSVMTLEAGDLLLTGSPSGVGFSLTPRQRLEPGDEVVVSIEGLSTLVNSVRQES